MKRTLYVVFIVLYLLVLLLLESAIVTVLVVNLYGGVPGCDWTMSYYYEFFIRFYILKSGAYFIVYLILYLGVFKRIFLTSSYLTYKKLVVLHVVDFYFIQLLLIAIFQKGGLEMGLGNCISLPVKYLIVGFAVAASPVICKATGFTNLLFKSVLPKS